MSGVRVAGPARGHAERSAARLAAALAILLSGCAAGGHATRPAAHAARQGTTAPPVDSATVLLWDFDETGGTIVPDSGRGGIEGTAGVDTHTEFGRIRGARVFTRSIESFVWADARASLECPAAITVEAWIRLDDVGLFEDTPIAGRWSPVGNEQSWLFSVGGRGLQGSTGIPSGPGDHVSLVPISRQGGLAGRLMFAFQPRDAGAPRSYFSAQALELKRWTHVAVTYDGHVVRFYIDAILDSQFASSGEIRPSNASLLVGNAFDSRWLTNQNGELRVRDNVDRYPYYALVGALDELRISDVARSGFRYAH